MTSSLTDHSRNCKVGKNKDDVKTVQCEHCQKTFVSEVSLHVYLRNVFQGPYVCKPCKKSLQTVFLLLETPARKTLIVPIKLSVQNKY